MKIPGRAIRRYFNFGYNPVYDATVARLSGYRRLQNRCVATLEPAAQDRVLCVGIGTGNELIPLLEAEPSLRLTGVDYSPYALQKARQKAARHGARLETGLMDAHHLEFPAGSFDKALGCHVADFAENPEQVCRELCRILVKGGRFTVTFPANTEGFSLLLSIITDRVQSNLHTPGRRHRAFLEPLLMLVAGVFYLPLLLRPRRRQYDEDDLHHIFRSLPVAEYTLELDPVYQDYIVTAKT